MLALACFIVSQSTLQLNAFAGIVSADNCFYFLKRLLSECMFVGHIFGTPWMAKIPTYFLWADAPIFRFHLAGRNAKNHIGDARILATFVARAVANTNKLALLSRLHPTAWKSSNEREIIDACPQRIRQTIARLYHKSDGHGGEACKLADVDLCSRIEHIWGECVWPVVFSINGFSLDESVCDFISEQFNLIFN